ncbi:MAG: helix-hairpin-helix domain-containing protein [Chitinophagales bacterium]
MNTPALRELQIIPGVGKSIAQDLLNIGITKVTDLKNKNPEKLYQQLNAHYGVKQDICLLYVMRCAVYFASHKKHEPEKLKWWNWR